ncbi:zf-DHHC-domain-containing protein [Hysterangium stoloniferum]|nr:zf-DHHC-domain-containing protein [Hysterangium stoloniferum]
MTTARNYSTAGRIWVTGTTLLIAFIAYSVQVFVIYPWYGSEISIDLLKLLVPFNLLIGLLYLNYFKCVMTEPGSVPHRWKPEGDDIEVKKLTGGPRYCRTCDNYKPPRAHHCRQCKRFVISLDSIYHHCPWINNCVGHFNYAHFLRFLIYVDISCIYHIWMLTTRVFNAYSRQHGYWIEPSVRELVFIILNYVACVPVLLAVGGFSMYHIYCLLTNTTTIEGWEKDTVATLIRRGKIREIKFPYNLGVLENVYSVFGRSVLYWPFPIKETSSGLKFKIADGEGKWIEFHQVWPPEDPYKIEEYTGPAHDFTQDISPWTYGDGINPNLQPSNTYNRFKSGRSNVPPYHPAYQTTNDLRRLSSTSSQRSSSDEYEDRPNAPLVRRGSEGWEVHQPDREELLRRYLESIGETDGRYQRYVPEDASDDDEDGDDDKDDRAAFERHSDNPPAT